MAVTSGSARKNSTTNPAATATSMQRAALVTAVHTPLLIEPVVRVAQPPAIPHSTKSETIKPTEKIPMCAHAGSHVSMARLSTSKPPVMHPNTPPYFEIARSEEHTSELQSLRH